MKVCNLCKEAKPLESFSRNSAVKRDGRMGRCKACRKTVTADSNEYRKLRKVEAAGRPPALCEACGIVLTTGRTGSSAACWDHNHSTGKFRGWLCTSCNKALGLVKDSTAILAQLIDYLNKQTD